MPFLPTPDERGGIPESSHILPYIGATAEYNKESPPASLVADKGGNSSKWSTYCMPVCALTSLIPLHLRISIKNADNTKLQIHAQLWHWASYMIYIDMA